MAPTPSNLRERIIGVDGVPTVTYSRAALDAFEAQRPVNQAATTLVNLVPEAPLTSSTLANPIPEFAANGQLQIQSSMDVNQGAHAHSLSQQAQGSSSDASSSSSTAKNTIKPKHDSFEQKRPPSPEA
ncbi:hypothetical protein BGZ93_008456 [Podila epicladia]|nr:hypothetical protein BGZ92_002175 [Podila epicladia]KAG0092133.1 hypothetical protein BGZ93_008456 [Podila epicladia]